MVEFMQRMIYSNSTENIVIFENENAMENFIYALISISND